MATLFGMFPLLSNHYADGGYQGPKFEAALLRCCTGSRLRSSSDPMRPKASRCCPNAGSWNAPSAGSTAAARSPRIGNASTARRSPSCDRPLSGSCCESAVIPSGVLGQTPRAAGSSGNGMRLEISTLKCQRVVSTPGCILKSPGSMQKHIVSNIAARLGHVANPSTNQRQPPVL